MTNTSYDILRHTRAAYWVTNATDTRLEYVTVIASPTQKQ
jgi:hypothetical protein